MAKLSAKKKLESQYITIFRAGTHKDSSGKTHSFSNDDIDSIVENTDLSSAANVIHHPTKTSYSFAGFADLKRVGNALKAKLKDSAAGFAESIQAGLFPTRSVRFSNGKLEHLGWLPKGVSPAVEGMPAVQFSAPEDGTVEYSESNDDIDFAEVNGWELKSAIKDIASVLHSIRESIIEKDGIEAADRTVPMHRIEWIRSAEIIQKANEKTEDSISTNYEEPIMAVEDKKKKENPSGSEQDFENTVQAEVAKRAASLNRKHDFEKACDKLAGEGKLTPFQKASLQAVHASFETAGIAATTIDFEKDGAVSKTSMAELLTDFMGSLPVQLDLSGKEIVKKENAADFSGDEDESEGLLIAQTINGGE